MVKPGGFKIKGDEAFDRQPVKYVFREIRDE